MIKDDHQNNPGPCDYDISRYKPKYDKGFKIGNPKRTSKIFHLLIKISLD